MLQVFAELRGLRHERSRVFFRDLSPHFVPPNGPLHLLMTFSDGGYWSMDTISAHRAVLAKHSAVWLGKFGKTLGHGHVGVLNTQCREGVRTHLYLVKKVGKAHEVYRGAIAEVTRSVPSDRDLIPSYYLDLFDDASVWFKLHELSGVEKGILDRLHVVSSGASLSWALRHALARMFIIREGESPFPEAFC